ncbi:MAG: cold shock domain-containing protein [Anaerolineales bacterium]|nr:cold shock domain-containing protein [Anaerolineales bacterium]
MAEFNDPQSTLNDDLSAEPRQTGYVKWFDNRKGYGFIRREAGDDVFVHFSSINRERQTLNEHDRVEFTAVPAEKGPEARNVVVLAEASDQ